MTTAQERLNSILPSWYELLTQWSLDGSLVAAASEALVLEGSNAKKDAEGQLQSLVSQWSAGNFKSLPEIVLLSNADISGAQGAYADSTDTIYLNSDWLLTATEEQILKVLTEELGHSLDDQLNQGDTQGDEGAYFSYQIITGNSTAADQSYFQSLGDKIFINVNSNPIQAQASTVSASTSTGSYLSLDAPNGDYLSTNKYYVPESGDFTVSVWAKAYSVDSGRFSEILSQGKSVANGFYIGYDANGYIRIGDSWGIIRNGSSWYSTLYKYPTDGAWHNFQVTKQGSIGTLYLDGVLIETDANFFNPLGGTYLRIGQQFVDENTTEGIFNEYFNGAIDEVKIYASALTKSELDSVRNNQAISTPSVFATDFENGLNAIETGGALVSLTPVGSPTIVSFDPTIITSYVLQSEFLSNGNLYAIVNAQNYSFPADDIFYKSPANAASSWMLAESYAKQLGGNLATIDSSQENEVIRNFIESYAASNALVQSFSSYQDIGAWIGLYFDRTTGQWSWSSTGQAADYINFAPTDSNTNGGDSDYVAMYSVDSWAPQDPGQWNDHENGMSIGVVEIPYTQYQDSAYVIVSGNTFEEARFNAQQLGGDLAILNSQAEFDFLVNTYQGYQAQWQSLWLGLTDAAEEGKWLNVDGTLAGYSFNGEQNYLPWHLAEPNDFQGEDYGVLNWSEYWAGQFDIGRPGVMDPAGLNDINNFTATGYDKPIYGIAEIKLPQPAHIIGTATSDATPVIISGNLTAPTVESYSTTTSGRGKNKTTVGVFADVTIDKSAPLDALVVNGGESNNTITGNGFVDNASTSINETRSAFTGVLVIDGKGGADTITGGASGTNWLIGGGVSSVGTVDTLIGVALTTDIFDLRRNVADAWQDAYSVGNAVINGYDLGDYIVLAKDPNQYQVVNQTQTIERFNKRGKVIGVDTVTYFEIKDIAGDLIATVNGTSFTPSSSTADLKIVYGQSSQDPFEVVLPSAIPGTII